MGTWCGRLGSQIFVLTLSVFEPIRNEQRFHPVCLRCAETRVKQHLTRCDVLAHTCTYIKWIKVMEHLYKMVWILEQRCKWLSCCWFWTKQTDTVYLHLQTSLHWLWIILIKLSQWKSVESQMNVCIHPTKLRSKLRTENLLQDKITFGELRETQLT